MAQLKFISVVVLFLSIVLSTPAFAAGKVLVGIMPVYDVSGESFGDDVARNLTFIVFRELQANPAVEPVLLMPGGVYTPTSDDWIQEYARNANVDAVVIMQFDSDRNRRGPTTLKLSAEVRDVNGKAAPKQAVTDMLKHEDYTALVQAMSLGGTTAATMAVGMKTGMWWDFGGVGSWLTAGPRGYEKTPIGKIAKKFGLAVRDQVASQAPTLVASGTAPNIVAGGAPCPIGLRIRYTKRNASSKAYTLIVNGKEETASIGGDGIASLQAPSGPLVLQIELKDAPYRLPIQGWYQASTLLDCKQPEKKLLMAVGAAGEGLLSWEQ